MLASVGILIFSCQKSDDESLTNKFTVDDAKQWYTKTQPEKPCLSPARSQKAIGNNSAIDIRCYWEKATTYQNGNETVIEIPLQTLGKFGFIKGKVDVATLDEDGRLANSLTKLVIVKQRAKNPECWIMTLIADSEYMIKANYDLNANTYLKKTSDYTGMVLHHSPNGVFCNGLYYKNGIVIGTISQNDDQILITRPKIADSDCYATIVTTYVQTCTDWYENGYYTRTSCGAWRIESTYTYTTCEATSGGGGGDGGDGGTTGTTIAPKTIGFTTLDINKIAEIEKYLTLHYCPNSKVFSTTWNSSITIGYNSTLPADNPSRFNSLTDIMEFRDYGAISDISLLHEFFHAYQDTYWGNPQSPTQLGEFEAYLMVDLYLNFNNKYLVWSNNLSPDMQDAYIDWLCSIEQNGTASITNSAYMYWFNQFINSPIGKGYAKNPIGTHNWPGAINFLYNFCHFNSID